MLLPRPVLLCLSALAGGVLSSPLEAQLPTGWKAHDTERPAPPAVTPAPEDRIGQPPSDAIVLFDGTSLDAWRNADGGKTAWKIVDGVMESVPGSGYIYTKEEFGDIQLHLEFASPKRVEGRGQGRGNSGVFLMGLYEIQVLDSWENPTYADGSAGSIYGQYPPLVNASRGPGEWQSFDIIFRRALFDEQGELTQPARATVLHNGVLVQDCSEMLGPTRWQRHRKYRDIGPAGPLSLQDHGNPVRYRNIWLRPLQDRPAPQPDQYAEPKVSLTDEQLDELVGQYGQYKIERRDDGLHMVFAEYDFLLIPVGEREFTTSHTYNRITFETDKDGRVSQLRYQMGGGDHRAKRNN